MAKLSSYAAEYFVSLVVLGRTKPENLQSSPSLKLPSLRATDPPDTLEPMLSLLIPGVIKLGQVLASFLRPCKTTEGIVSVCGAVPARTNPGPGRGSRVSAAVVCDRPRRALCFGASLRFMAESGIFGVGAIRPLAVACLLRGSSWSFSRSYRKYSY